MSEDFGEDLVASLKELVLNIGPVFNASDSLEDAEDQLIHLEESDGNFHKYEYVKKLRMQIESALGDFIDEEIDKHSIHPNDASAGMESVVSRITNRVLHSKEYSSLTLGLKSSVNEACHYLLQNFVSEFSSGYQHGTYTAKTQKRRRSEVIFSSDGDSSYSLNQSSFMFMSSDMFRTAAEELDKRKSIEVRRDALRKLSQVHTIDDVLNYESWDLMRQGLQDALADKDDILWMLSLKFIARGFSSTNQSSKELYSTMLDYMSLQFQTSKSSIPKLKNGIDITNENNEKLLKAFRLMNEFQLQIPQYWVRYSEKFLDDIIEATLSLLSISHGTALASTQINPIHFLALIDPQANWFVKWMHGHYSRGPLLKALKRHCVIVDLAVKSCVDYISSNHGQQVILGDQTIYGGHELEFVYFVHSIYLIGSLLCHNQGRSFFPVKVKDLDGSINVTKLIVCLLQLITSPTITYDTSAARFDPCSLVLTQVLKKVCASENTCKSCVCKDAVTDALLTPIQAMLGQSVQVSRANEKTLLQIADILSMIASTSCGRHHLLFGEQISSKKSTSVHLLCEFAKRALNEELSSHGLHVHPSKAAIGNYIFVCRQLYNNCVGYQVIQEYNLHESIATAWKIANREADNASTPTPSLEGKEVDRESQYILLWEETLRDNLLNFAGTPLGVLLVEQTGAINECVSYMHSRYERKLQVSKCEKFGYGYMMSQIAATAPGMRALESTGFLKGQIHNLWGILEATDDFPVYTPKSWPVLPIDKYTKKIFTNLANLLSAYPAVYELLCEVKLPSKMEYSLREMPDSLDSLIDRIFLVETDAKVHALFNPEQSHIFGLRLLSLLSSCLDTSLLLQSQYDFQGKLFLEQAANVVEGSTDVVIDMLSLERNYILVKSFIVGGPTERILPERTLDESNMFTITLFLSYPVPQQYIAKMAKSSMKQENELGKFLSDSKKAPLNNEWLDKCKRFFCSVMTAKPDQALRGNVLQDLFDKCTTALLKNPKEVIFPLCDVTGLEQNAKSVKLTPYHLNGIALAIRYGQQLKLLSSVKDATENLKSVYRMAILMIQQHQKNISKSPLHCLKKNHCGFDWFVCTIFLLMGGNKDKTWKFLQKFSSLAISAYVWKHRIHASNHLSQPLISSGIPLVFSKTCHYVELILQSEVSLVHSAFKMSGYAPAQICQHWLRQCFWNYLDWQEICHYLSICVCLGMDYQVYFCVAILKFLQTRILQETQEKNLIIFLKEQPINGFKCGEHLEYMQQLERKHRKLLIPSMFAINKL